MANPGSWAVTLPDNSAQTENRLLSTLYLRGMQQQRLQSLQQQREFMRNQDLTKYLGDNFKDNQFATGDPTADPLINNMTSDAKEYFAKVIHEHPEMDESQLEMMMQQKLGEISQYAARVRGVRKTVEAQTAKLSNEPGIDTPALAQGSMTNFLFNIDKNGNKTLKTYDQLDPNQNYVNNELNAHPNLYVQGELPLTKAIESYKSKKGGDTQISENRGVTTENKYTDQVYPWQTLQKDAKGNVTGVQTTTQPATLSDGTVLKDPKTGQPLQVVSDETMGMFSTPGVQAQIRRDVHKYISDNGMKPEDFPDGSEGYNILAKHMMADKLNSLTPSEFTHERKTTDASLVTKMQLGFTDALGRSITKADQRREDELLNGPFGRLRQAANFSPEAVQAGVPYTDPASGKQFIDVTDFTGGIKTAADKKATQFDPGYKQVQRVLLDPQNPGNIYTVEGTDGHIQQYNPSDIDALQLRHSEANGIKSLSDVKTIIGKIPIQPNTAAARQLRAEMEFKRRQLQNLNPALPVPTLQ